MKFLGFTVLAGCCLFFLGIGVMGVTFWWANQAYIGDTFSGSEPWRPLARLGLGFVSISIGIVFGGSFVRSISRNF